jgi:hypothetical protein
VPVIVSTPVADGVNMTEQVAVAPVPLRVQLVALNDPAPLLVKLTVLLGVIAVPGEVSVTVAVHEEL